MALDVTPEIGPIEWPLVIPYLLVLILALWGMNVMLVLLIGLVTTGIVGTLTGTPFFSWLGAMGEGIMGMSELIIVTLLAGGMLEMIRFNGGIAFIIKKMTKHIKGKRGAEMSIGILVGLADLCTANNTIAIITTAPIARQISQQFALDKRKVASILDTFSQHRYTTLSAWVYVLFLLFCFVCLANILKKARKSLGKSKKTTTFAPAFTR